MTTWRNATHLVEDHIRRQAGQVRKIEGICHDKHLKSKRKFRPRLYDVHREGACKMRVLRASIGVRYQISLKIQYQVRHRLFAPNGYFNRPVHAESMMEAGQYIAPLLTSPLLYQHEHHNFKAEGCNLGCI
jgi:hypothetical protein